MKKEGDKIIVSMEEYAKSLEKIVFRNGLSEEVLNDVEMKVYKKFV